MGQESWDLGNMGLAIGYMSFGAAALAYLVLALFYLLYGRWGGHGPYLLTAVWALLNASYAVPVGRAGTLPTAASFRPVKPRCGSTAATQLPSANGSGHHGP